MKLIVFVVPRLLKILIAILILRLLFNFVNATPTYDLLFDVESWVFISMKIRGSCGLITVVEYLSNEGLPPET
jgi:hypothetical protein